MSPAYEFWCGRTNNLLAWRDSAVEMETFVRAWAEGHGDTFLHDFYIYPPEEEYGPDGDNDVTIMGPDILAEIGRRAVVERAKSER